MIIDQSTDLSRERDSGACDAALTHSAKFSSACVKSPLLLELSTPSNNLNSVWRYIIFTHICCCCYWSFTETLMLSLSKRVINQNIYKKFYALLSWGYSIQKKSLSSSIIRGLWVPTRAACAESKENCSPLLPLLWAETLEYVFLCILYFCALSFRGMKPWKLYFAFLCIELLPLFWDESLVGGTHHMFRLVALLSIFIPLCLCSCKHIK